MVLESVIVHVVEQQKIRLSSRDSGLKRELIPATKSLSSHALIISGVRRCGKSTLLMQMMEGMNPGRGYVQITRIKTNYTNYGSAKNKVYTFE